MKTLAAVLSLVFMFVGANAFAHRPTGLHEEATGSTKSMQTQKHDMINKKGDKKHPQNYKDITKGANLRK